MTTDKPEYVKLEDVDANPKPSLPVTLCEIKKYVEEGKIQKVHIDLFGHSNSKMKTLSNLYFWSGILLAIFGFSFAVEEIAWARWICLVLFFIFMAICGHLMEKKEDPICFEK